MTHAGHCRGRGRSSTWAAEEPPGASEATPCAARDPHPGHWTKVREGQADPWLCLPCPPLGTCV